jgi:hypothetical protein
VIFFITFCLLIEGLLNFRGQNKADSRYVFVALLTIQGVAQNLLDIGCVKAKNPYEKNDLKVSVHLIITVRKTSKNILNSFSHLPRQRS